MFTNWIAIISLFCVVEAQFNCNHANLTDVDRQKVVDFHGSFRKAVAMNMSITYKNNVFYLPQGKNMYGVTYNCELERLAQTRISQCAVNGNDVTNSAGVTITGGYYPLPPEGQQHGATIYNIYRQWLWEYYQNLNATTLEKKEGLEGATFLYKYNLQVGCAIKQNCWINVDNVTTKMQAFVCAYYRVPSTPSTVYEQGVGCKNDSDCTTYPATCRTDVGVCLLKSKQPPYGQLSVNGSKLLRQNGQPAVLHGMSLFGTNKKDGLQYYTNDVIQQLKCNWNTNAFRAVLDIGTGVSGGYIHTQRDFPNKYHDKQRVDTVIKAAIEHGVYVIIDWHGVPSTMEQYLPEAKEYFKYVSEVYGIFPHVIYETFNEPYNRTWSQIRDYHLAVLPSIRKFDKKNVIILGTEDYSGRPDLSVQNPVTGYDNLCYTYHFYVSGKNMTEVYTNRVEEPLNNGLCVFSTEYGTTNGNGRTGFYPVETKSWWDYLDSRNISYFNWAVSDAEVHKSSALKNDTLPADIGQDDKLSQSGALVKAKYKSQNNDVVC